MSSIEEKANELVSDFELFGDWEDKYEYIISLGKESAPMEESKRIEDNIVKGCQSRVWLVPEQNGDKVVFEADSDAIITKGIIALLVKVVNQEKPADIARYEFDFIDQIGLKEHLSPNRSNGLVSMIKKMKTYALAMANK